MNLKELAAQRALDFVQSHMTLGLGTGSTLFFFIQQLGERLQSGQLRDLRAVPTSESTAHQAQELGIPLVSLADYPHLDLAVDGADEIDPSLNLIKGLGKALLREKIVAVHAAQFLIIADESKLTPRLGKGPLPVEILPFEAEAHVHWLRSLGCRAELWRDEAGRPYQTDNGNYLARCWFSAGIPDAYSLAHTLSERPGIVEHGLFLDLAQRVLVAGEGGVQVLERPA